MKSPRFSSRALPRRWQLLFVATTLATLLTPMPCSRAAIPPAEKLLPEDTLLVVAIPDVAGFRGICEKLPQIQLWRDPAMKPFHDQFMARWNEELVEPLERDLGVNFEDYAALPQGQLTFAVTQEGWRGTGDHPPALLLLVETRGKSSQLRTNLVSLRKKWIDAGKTVRTETVRGVDFSVASLSSNDVPETIRQFFPQSQEIREAGRNREQRAPQREELVVGQCDSLLIVGTSLNAVEKVVMRLAGGGEAPALADEAGFDANRLTMFRGASLFGWINAKAVLDVLGRVPPEAPNPEAPSPLPPLDPNRILDALGLIGLKAISFDFREANDGLIFEVFLRAPETGRQGLFKMLAVEARDSTPPVFTPADVLKFQRWRLDGQKAWWALKTMLSRLSPQALNTWNFLVESAEVAAKDKDPGYDLERDFVGHLGDDFIRYTKSPKGNPAAGLDSPPSLFLIGSPDAGTLLAGLRGPLALWSPRAQNADARDFLGRKIFTIPIVGGLPFLGVAKPTQGHLHYAAGNGYVALSTDAGMVEEFLRNSESHARSLRELARLPEATQEVGGPAGGLWGYENQSEYMRGLFEALKKPAGMPTNPPGALNPLANSLPFARPQKSFRDWMDFALLPDFDRVAKYYSYSVYGGSVNVEGITFRCFYPMPPQLSK